MRERTRLEHELELLLPPSDHETPPVAIWPPRGLGGVPLRHWRIDPAAPDKPAVLQPADLDPGFVAGPAPDKSCLKDWLASKHPAAKAASVALVDLSGGGSPKYTGVRDKVSVNLLSCIKVSVMYAGFQFRHDMQALANRDAPADMNALGKAALDQWARDLVDAKIFARPADARKWIGARAPKIDQIVTMDSARKVEFTSNFLSDITSMIKSSDNNARMRCLARLGDVYIASLRSQSGKLGRFNIRGWTGSAEAVAALLTLIAGNRLVGEEESKEMRELLRKGAMDGVSTWMRYALEGRDNDSDSTLTRPYESIAGKIGFLYRGKEATWDKNVFHMTDASLVVKAAGADLAREPRKEYLLVFATPAVGGTIQRKDILPLIRKVHDCVVT